MRPEILAPVGSKESLEAALAAGCDAIYFGLPSFGARAYANNFDLETTKEVIERCHLMNVKVFSRPLPSTNIMGFYRICSLRGMLNPCTIQ